jgi:hypothetical protein
MMIAKSLRAHIREDQIELCLRSAAIMALSADNPFKVIATTRPSSFALPPKSGVGRSLAKDIAVDLRGPDSKIPNTR